MLGRKHNCFISSFASLFLTKGTRDRPKTSDKYTWKMWFAPHVEVLWEHLFSLNLFKWSDRTRWILSHDLEFVDGLVKPRSVIFGDITGNQSRAHDSQSLILVLEKIHFFKTRLTFLSGIFLHLFWNRLLMRGPWAVVPKRRRNTEENDPLCLLREDF